MRLATLLFLAAFVTLSQAARAAADSERLTMVLGFVDMSCGAWAKSASSPEVRQVYLYWIRGFVSGYNYGSKAKEVTIEAMPNQETLTLYVDKFCRDKPLSLFVGAAFSLVKEVGTTK